MRLNLQFIIPFRPHGLVFKSPGRDIRFGETIGETVKKILLNVI